MKIVPCLPHAVLDPTIMTTGLTIEVSQIPRIGEKIQISLNLFRHLFEGVNNECKEGILFINAVTEGTVVDIIHTFKAMEKPLVKNFFFNPNPPGEIHYELNDVNEYQLEQITYVVIKFKQSSCV